MRTVMLLATLALLIPGGNTWAGGDPARGAGFYTTCAGCHGPDGKGNEAQGAPIIAGQHSWYLVRQLQNFRAGARGTQPGDDWGALMRSFALSLPDDQAVEDVAAYVASLGQ